MKNKRIIEIVKNLDNNRRPPFTTFAPIRRRLTELGFDWNNQSNQDNSDLQWFFGSHKGFSSK